MRRTKTAKVVRLPKNLQAVAGGESLQGALGKQIWTLAGEDSPSPVLCFPRHSQRPPKPHKREKSHLTLPGKRITMKSPKDIAKAAFMGAGFRVPFSGGLRYMIPHFMG